MQDEELEERLERIESKLDKIIERFEMEDRLPDLPSTNTVFEDYPQEENPYIDPDTHLFSLKYWKKNRRNKEE